MTRALGIDFGSRRVGLALSDAGGVLASPLATIERTRDDEALHRRLAAIVGEHEVDVVVVGLPLGLDGREGQAVRSVRRDLDALAAEVRVPVVTHDERFTTVTAHQQLRAAGLDGRRRRGVVDQQAAVVLLQSWLDAERADAR